MPMAGVTCWGAAGPGAGTVLFTTTCPYCQRSAPTVLRAARQLQANLPGRPQLLGVCQCDAAQAARYAHVHGFDFPVVTLTDRRTLMLFRARNVPLLMAIDGQGRVRHSRLGVFDTTERVQDLVAALRRMDAPAAFCNGEGVMHEEALGDFAECVDGGDVSGQYRFRCIPGDGSR